MMHPLDERVDGVRSAAENRECLGSTALLHDPLDVVTVGLSDHSCEVIVIVIDCDGVKHADVAATRPADQPAADPGMCVDSSENRLDVGMVQLAVARSTVGKARLQ